MISFDIYDDGPASQPYRWRIESGNHRILAHSEQYTNYADALAAVRLVIAGASSAKIYNHTKAA